MRTFLLSLCLLAATTLARADAPIVAFGGENYHLDYEDAARLPDGQPGDALAEFTLPGQTVNDWTKLFAYYVYPAAGGDAAQMASRVADAVVADNPNAKYVVRKSKTDDEAMIDFLTWQPGSDVMEFDVFKYAPAKYGPGLVGVQFAQRFKSSNFDVKAFRAVRERALEAMASTDPTQARTYFAAKAKERLGSARGAGQDNAAPAGAQH
jgi:hypothetical protein